MKALSIKQPWADYIVSGQKDIETRTWATAYRGPLLIVSSKKPNRYNGIRIPDNRLGHALAITTLVDVRPMRHLDIDRALCDWNPRLYSWFLDYSKPITPFPVIGKRGLYEFDMTEFLVGHLLEVAFHPFFTDSFHFQIVKEIPRQGHIRIPVE